MQFRYEIRKYFICFTRGSTRSYSNSNSSFCNSSAAADEHGDTKAHCAIETLSSHLPSRSGDIEVTVKGVPSESQSLFAGASPNRLYADVWDATLCFRVTLKHATGGYQLEKKSRIPASHCRAAYGAGLGSKSPLFEGSAMARTSSCLNAVPQKEIYCKEEGGGTPPPPPPPAPGTHSGQSKNSGKTSPTGFDFLFYIGVTTLAAAGCMLACCLGLILRRSSQTGKAVKYTRVKMAREDEYAGLTRRNGGAHNDVELGQVDVDRGAFGIDEDDLDDDLDFRRSDDL